MNRIISFSSTEVTFEIGGVEKTYTAGQTIAGRRAGRFAVLGFRQSLGGYTADRIESVIVDTKAVGPNGELGCGKCPMQLDCFA